MISIIVRISIRGIAKSGDLLRAPRQKSTKLGWGLIFLGFLLNLISLVLF